MLQELWGLFPRLMEQNINGLLDRAEPNPARAYQIYKTCQREAIWLDTFEKFSRHLGDFFARPKMQRKKSDFDRFLQRPMDQSVYERFHLDFRSAAVPEKSVSDLASWAHNLMRVTKKSGNAAISFEVLHKTLRAIVNPPPYEKAKDIDFEDFCAVWKKTVAHFFGTQKDPEFEELLAELDWINTNLKESEKNARENAPVSLIYLTQTEKEWATQVRQAAFSRVSIPKFPLARGAQKLALLELERCISLYRIVQVSKQDELVRHRESIRATILDRCDRLLGALKSAA